MTYYLFLDDERKPLDVTWVQLPKAVYWSVVRNYDEFVRQIKMHGVPKHISFDHDLADFHYEAMLQEANGKENVDYGSEKTGHDCAKWLVDYCIDNDVEVPDYTVHSMNPIGKERIENYIENYKRSVGQ